MPVPTANSTALKSHPRAGLTNFTGQTTTEITQTMHRGAGSDSFSQVCVDLLV